MKNAKEGGRRTSRRYFEEEEDPQETWEDNEFDNCPEWFTKDKMPKSWDEVEKYIKLN